MGNNTSANMNKKVAAALPQQRQIDDRTYYLPQRDEDIDRLQIQHFLLEHVWQSNYSAPIHSLLKSRKMKVLDAGCGPGTWLLQMASENQSVEFFGVDILPIFPSEIKPANLQFRVADLTVGTPFEDNYFDYVRVSMLNWCLSADQWPVVLKELHRVLRPGGWLEIADMDRSKYSGGKNMDILSNLIGQLFSQRKVIPFISEKLPELLAPIFPSAQLYHASRQFHLGPRGGKYGKIFLELLDTFFLITIKSAAKKVLNMSDDDYEAFWKGVTEELETYDLKIMCNRFWVQKVMGNDGNARENKANQM